MKMIRTVICLALYLASIQAFSGVFTQSIALVDLGSKYEEQSRHGLVALEDIKTGSVLWSRTAEDKSWFTRNQLLQLMQIRPAIAQAIIDFSCQSGHDLFTVPTACLNGEKIDERQFINHSCDPNAGYWADEQGKTHTIALRDIKKGEEITKDYGTLETEASLTYGLKCTCGAATCSGTWKYDLYRRDDEYGRRMIQYAKPELLALSNALRREFWYSPKVYLRRLDSKVPLQKRELVLNALQPIASGELIGRTIDGTMNYVLVDRTRANSKYENGQLIATTVIAPGTDIILDSDVIVYCDGIFDLFHKGHQDYLRKVRKHGTRLIVGVLGDREATDYKRKPINPDFERKAVVSEFEGVDMVVAAPMFVDEKFLEQLKIDVVCISPEYDQADDAYYAVPRAQGRVRVMTRTPGISTTELVERVQTRNVVFN